MSTFMTLNCCRCAHLPMQEERALAGHLGRVLGPAASRKGTLESLPTRTLFAFARLASDFVANPQARCYQCGMMLSPAR